ncbi:5HT1F-like protein [Mya arenaria]|uniref:5HT1F-like protein n=2 Tax=Mya arenaria TaxID=6604 RepID=A0ABY7FUE3_MYAAR|nr:5HT1F-like protein [Mya arenaria]
MAINFAAPNDSTTMTNSTNSELLDSLMDEMRAAVTPVSVFVGIEMVIGFFGNLLVLYVFLFRYHHCNFRYFVLSLACLDFTSTVTTMPAEILSQQFWYTYPFPTVCTIKSFFNMFTISGEALCLFVIAVDRHRKALVLCFFIFATAILITLPVPFLFGTHNDVKLYAGRNVTVRVCEKDMAYVNSNMPFNYALSVQGILATSLLIMFILYVKIFRKISGKKTNFKRDAGFVSNSDTPRKCEKRTSVFTINEVEMPGTLAGNTSDNTSVGYATDNDSACSDAKKTAAEPVKRTTRHHKSKMPGSARRKTYISLVLTVVFLLTTALYLVLLTFITLGILETLTNMQRAFYFLGFRLVFINHVINPLVYGCLDPQFTKVLNDVKKCCRRKNT